MQRWILFVSLLVVGGCAAATQTSLDYPAGQVNNASNSEAGTTQALDRATVSPPSATRRIIYQADVDLVVKSLDDFEAELPKQIRDHGGFLADARTDRTEGHRPFGTWTVRVPVERFESFLGAMGDAGFAQRVNQTSQDVTAEYVDLESRITNARRLEERIVKLLDTTPGEIQQVLNVERELARARGDLEQLEGRRRLLENRTALSTVILRARERDEYVPPQTPTFDERLARAWYGSWAELARFGEACAIAVVTVLPWLALLFVLLLPFALAAYRLHRTARTRRAVVA